MHIHKFATVMSIAALLGGFNSPARGEDIVVRAMSDELTRTMDSLQMEKMPKPYYLAYWVQDEETWSVSARYEAIVQSTHSLNRYLSIDLRVGSPASDNSGFASDWEDLHRNRQSLTDEDNYGSLRHEIWLATDAAYKNALEKLSQKQSYLQTHPASDSTADFVPGEKVVYTGKSTRHDPLLVHMQDLVRNASGVLNKYNRLQEWQVTYLVGSTVKRFNNSEKSQTFNQGTRCGMQVSATILAPDGERLCAVRDYIAKSEAEMPTEAQLTTDIEKLAGDLIASADVAPIKEYVGPVLFRDFAAAQLIGKLFAEQITPAKPVICSESWLSNSLNGGKLTGRLNQRVFPQFINVTDEPLRENWNGRPLFGSCEIDDDGFPAQDLTLVKDGRLVALPLGRAPTSKLSGSNGHGRLLPNQMVIPTVSNLIIESDETESANGLLKKLRKLADESGLKYGLLITGLSDPNVANSYAWIEANREEEGLLPAPVIAYKVDVKDGTITPVRGVVFSDVSVRNLRDIVATGKDRLDYPMTLKAPIGGYPYAVSIITPDLLVEEMELKAFESREPLPLTARPTD